jgi:hypothetical protein
VEAIEAAQEGLRQRSVLGTLVDLRDDAPSQFPASSPSAWPPGPSALPKARPAPGGLAARQGGPAGVGVFEAPVCVWN